MTHMANPDEVNQEQRWAAILIDLKEKHNNCPASSTMKTKINTLRGEVLARDAKKKDSGGTLDDEEEPITLMREAMAAIKQLDDILYLLIRRQILN